MATQILTPPITPDQPSVSVLVDHLAATLPLDKMPELMEVIGGEDWSQLPYGRRGYLHGMTKDGMQVHYAGEPTRNKEGQETLHLIIHGSGCRNLEAAGVIGPCADMGITWEAFISLLLSLGGGVRRLDLAIDERTGDLLPKMVEATQADMFTSRFKAARGFIDFKRGKEGTGQVEGLVFGDRASQAYIRAYDKASEQRGKGIPYEGECTRVEVEFKGNKAHAIARKVATDGNLSFLPGIIRGLLDFKQPSDDKTRSRWPTVHWWEDFLGHCAKVRLAVSPIIRTIEQVEVWIQKQVAPSLALLFTHYQGEWDKLEAIINQGRHRWKQRHRDILRRAAT